MQYKKLAFTVINYLKFKIWCTDHSAVSGMAQYIVQGKLLITLPNPRGRRALYSDCVMLSVIANKKLCSCGRLCTVITE
jgi:hypothetical protein